MKKQSADQLTEKVTNLLEELFQQENMEDEEKFLAENGITVLPEDLKKFHEAKENIRSLANKKLTEAEMENISGGGPNFESFIKNVLDFVEVGTTGVSTYLTKESIKDTAIAVCLNLFGNYLQETFVQAAEEDVGYIAGLIASAIIACQNVYSISDSIVTIKDNLKGKFGYGK